MRIAAARSFVCVMVVIGALGGCGGATQPGWGARVVDWSILEAGKEPRPGIDSASVQFGMYGDGFGPVFWSDGRSGGFGASWDRDRSAVHYEGELAGADGKTIPIECFTADGKTGTVKIGESEFKLQDGPLFLIRLDGPQLVIQATPIDLADLEPNIEHLRKYAGVDPKIRDFFAAESPSTE